MEAWVRLSNERTIERGKFLETVLETNSGAPIHSEVTFLTHLAELVMQRYEGRPICQIRSLNGLTVEAARRTKRFYRRLFDSSGNVTTDFQTWTSETLVLWMESVLLEAAYAEAGAPHSSDPAFDVLTISIDDHAIPRLRLTQVKATEKQVQARGSEALSKFERLELGHYDAELANKLELIRYRGEIVPAINVSDLLFDSERRYRVAVIHDIDLNGLSILTNYDSKIPGPLERRSVCLVRVTWPDFWTTLGRMVYDQLS